MECLSGGQAMLGSQPSPSFVQLSCMWYVSLTALFAGREVMVLQVRWANKDHLAGRGYLGCRVNLG